MTWTCNNCGQPNLMHWTHCSRCGRPRGNSCRLWIHRKAESPFKLARLIF